MTKFAAILWKEWVSLKPFAILLFALFIFGLCFVQVTEFVDMYPAWDNMFGEADTIAIVNFVLCVVVSIGLMVREKDDGTLLYLDGLPITRTAVYCAKWLVAVGLIVTVNLFWTLEGFIYDLVSDTSMQERSSFRYYAVFGLLENFLAAFFVSIIVCFSFLRRWTLLVLGALFWLVFWLRRLEVPYAEFLNPFTLIQRPLEPGDPWQVPWNQLAVLSVVGLAAWIIGLITFNTRTGPLGPSRKWFQNSWIGKATGGCAIVLIPIVWLSLFAASLFDEEETYSDEPVVPEIVQERAASVSGGNRILTTESKHFQFVYRQKDETGMKPFIAGADEVFEKVADYLSVSDEIRSNQIIVDLTSPLGSHNAGQAYWKKIRMGLPDKTDEALAVLGHEATHVFIDQMTDGRLEESFSSTRWFHEGLASEIEFELFRAPEETEDYERWLALASSWGEVQFSELVEDGVLNATRDRFIVYPAGMVWVEALIDVYGREAPTALLTAIARPDGPRKLEGMARWRDACLAAGYDLEKVRANFRSRLKELRDEYAATTAKFPEVTEGTATRNNGKITITPVLPDGWRDGLPEGAEMICRMRAQPGSPPFEWQYSKLKKGDVFNASALTFLKPEMSFQVGWITGEWCKQHVFGEWVDVTIDGKGKKKNPTEKGKNGSAKTID
ncbi:ABC transporter permease [Verrucomicrobiales bacterium BCK34]|nr:ABC transporter permease [Verrucomicrobiales bacterium BCK34]